MESFDFYKPRRIGETINATFTFIRQEFVPLGKSILFIVGPSMLISAIIINSMFGEQFVPAPDFILASNYWLRFGSLIFLQLAIYALLIVVINNYILLYVNKDESRFSVQTIFNLSIRGFWNLFGITILFSIIIAFAFMLLFIPGIYLSVSLSLLYAVLVLEKSTMGEAFNRSAYLIRDYWWFTFGLLILIWIITFVLQLVFEGPFLLINFLYGLNQVDSMILTDYSWWVTISSVLSQLSYLVYAVFIVATTVHYYSQREKKEAAGLSQKIDALGENPVTE